MSGAVGVAARLTAAAALVAYGWAVLVVVVAVLRTARSSDRLLLAWPVVGAAAWLPVGVALDVVVVATTQRRAFDAVGVMLFIGALTQLILAVFLHVGPQLRGRDVTSRDALHQRTERFVRARSAALNVGVLAVVLQVGMGSLVRIGWIAIAVGVGAHLLPIIWPLGPDSLKQP